MIRIFLALLAVAAIAGCTGLGTLTQASKPNDLYLLTPKSTFSTSLPRIQRQIVVEEPTATAAVNTDQIAVQPTPLQVQYLPRARWVDRAPLIVQSLLVESYENSGKVAAVGRSIVGLRADYVIVPDLREFQGIVVAQPDGSSIVRVEVRMNIKIIDEFEDKIIASDSFQEYVISESDQTPDLVNAFDVALGKTMRDAVEWSVRRIHTHASNNPRSF
ncbi:MULTISPECIES: ABC-type transport auxiliary lipoprotein family protein [unclassified Ruegeria]|uniref:ABC-type transport auxiliary lipoprotein family protein n=1 Tax=unclassified Ruegeria TaxID=2625375 RepID=UPI001ADB382E|nr:MULTISPECIES: ABC-type transport auxiliary lipoprotein family protein [unclassified Ruegeria]MBO9412568.1 membrane integrity-associated transporter subunit PqiC [Ruegeria sp. R8_1]MBO9416194.1 membrane integrity-associated transporter subunit PqiC [Ruegeria sp. R8_2]